MQRSEVQQKRKANRLEGRRRRGGLILSAAAAVASCWLYPPQSAHANSYSWAGALGATATSWSVGPWTGSPPAGGPSAVGDVDTINTNITANQSISLAITGDGFTAAKTVGVLNVGDVDGSNTFTLAPGTGGGSFVLNNNGNGAQINELSTAKGDTISAPIAIADTAGLSLNNASSGTLTFSGAISSTGSGSLANLGSGAGTVAISSIIGPTVTGGVFQTSATSVLALNGLNTFTGGLTITRGTVSSSQGTIGGFGNGAISLGNTAVSNTDNAALLYGGNGTAVANTITVEAGSTGILSIESQGSNNTITGTITLNNALNLADLTANTMTISGVINGSSPISIGGGITNAGTVNIGASSATTATTYGTGTTSITLTALPNGLVQGDLISGTNLPAQAITGISGTTVSFATPTTGASNTAGVSFTGLTGGITINSGALSVNNALALGSGTLVIDGGALGGSATVATNNAQTWNADFAYDTTNGLNMGTGAVSLGTLTAGSARTVNFTAAGNLTIGGVINNGTGAASGVTTLIKSGVGTLTLSNAANAFTNLNVNGGTVATTATVAGSGSVNLPADMGTPFGTGNITLNGGALGVGVDSTVGSTTGYTKLDNNIVLGGAGTIATGGQKRVAIVAGLVSGTGPLTLDVSQGGTNGQQAGLYLNNTNNTYSGGTVLDAQTSDAGSNLFVVANAVNALGGGSGTGGVVALLNANAAVGINQYLVIEANQSIAGLSTSGSSVGQSFITGYSASTTTTLTINNTSGGTGDLSSYSGFIGGSPVAIGNVVTAGGNNIALAKTGTGLQILSGISNTFTGGTTISGGNLQINNASGSALGSGPVALGSADPSATISGTGSTTGLVTVSNSGRIAPGTNGTTPTGASYANFGSAGTLTLGSTGGLTLTNANLDFDLAATTTLGASDIIQTGALTLTSVGATFNGLGSSIAIGTPYVLIHYASTTATDASAFNLGTNFVGSLASAGYTATYSLDTTNDNVDVTFSQSSPTPEPTSLGVLGLGGLMMMRRRRKAAGKPR